MYYCITIKNYCDCEVFTGAYKAQSAKEALLKALEEIEINDDDKIEITEMEIKRSCRKN